MEENLDESFVEEAGWVQTLPGCSAYLYFDSFLPVLAKRLSYLAEVQTEALVVVAVAVVATAALVVVVAAAAVVFVADVAPVAAAVQIEQTAVADQARETDTLVVE